MTNKWLWMMDWCYSKGLAPAKNEVWELAEKEYYKSLEKTNENL